ncbi:MAG: type II toxin-antitoxin system VapC family toxin [Sulfurimonas sp.]|jgi:predicted nucleic acid-binding protein|nr:type II toxin-antitoxin system VapC family toxin [Sulfurimonadaceae bacterium]
MHNRVYLDTNILLDLLVDENKFSDYAKIRTNIELIKASKELIYNYISCGADLYINTSTLTNLSFLLSQRAKVSNVDVANEFLKLEASDVFKVVDEVKELRINASTFSKINNTDYEDTLQYFCAKNSNCDVVITNDENFPQLDISLIRTNPKLENYTPNKANGILDNVKNLFRKNI